MVMQEPASEPFNGGKPVWVDVSPPAGRSDTAEVVHAVKHWVPIRTLGPRHRRKMEEHLLALDAHDRYLRFGVATSDDQIKRYVASIDFRRDEAFGIFDRKKRLIAFAHLADVARPDVDYREPCSEFAVSVLPQARGRGYGAELFRMAALHSRNRGCPIMHIQALTENAPMLRIALRAGAVLERDGQESNAWLRLREDTVGTHVESWLLQWAAVLNDKLKRHGWRRRVD
jgi:GNAT superfamily N-acetyltransferase